MGLIETEDSVCPSSPPTPRIPHVLLLLHLHPSHISHSGHLTAPVLSVDGGSIRNTGNAVYEGDRGAVYEGDRDTLEVPYTRRSLLVLYIHKHKHIPDYRDRTIIELRMELTKD